jgi:hypothetical protein
VEDQNRYNERSLVTHCASAKQEWQKTGKRWMAVRTIGNNGTSHKNMAYLWRPFQSYLTCFRLFELRRPGDDIGMSFPTFPRYICECVRGIFADFYCTL